MRRCPRSKVCVRSRSGRKEVGMLYSLELVAALMALAGALSIITSARMAAPKAYQPAIVSIRRVRRPWRGL